MSIARNFVLAALLAPAWLLAPTPARAQQGGDLQAQIVYAYQAEDIHLLSDLIHQLAERVQADPADASLRYHLAHAQYRFGLLAGEARAREAESAFENCVDELKPVLRQGAKQAESLALQSACYAALANFKKLEAVLLRSRAGVRLQAALKLAPRNPRVTYLLSEEDLARAKPGSAEYSHAFSQLQLAAQLFEQSPATNADAPGWGHAETYLALGRELRLRGDVLAARNWIEKSLIVAPDYKAAQRELKLLATR